MTRPRLRLYRSNDNRMIAGVAGGLAEYFSVDVSFVRLLWVLVVFLGGAGVLAYILAWIVIPPARNELEVRGDAHADAIPVQHAAVQMRNRSSVVLGIILICLGIFFFAARFFSVNLYRYFWPFLLISLGVFILFGTSRKNP